MLRTLRNAFVLLTMIVLLAASLRAEAAVVNHQLDDGVGGSSIGITNAIPPMELLWLNVFDAAAGGETITQVSAVFGRDNDQLSPSGSSLVGGEAVTFVVWSDPTNDGNPADAVVLTTEAHNIVNFDDNVTPDVVNLTTPVNVTGKFFVGVVFSQTVANGLFPAAIDDSTFLPGVSWVVVGPTGTPIDLNDLGSASNPLALFEPGIGTWMVRAVGITLDAAVIEVPEPSTFALLGLGLVGYAVKRRRRTQR